jgi:putative endonuclease
MLNKIAQIFQRTGTKARGDAAEDAALAFLRRQGLQLEVRNYRIKGGEIDLIMRHAQTVVFVEVRARNRADFGGAAASVTTSKQQRIIKAAAHYLQQRKGATPACRFDVVGIAPAQAPQWIQSAFDAS